jgi:uncharacterized membrane protein YphA (DoxX/SURF4 family)
MIKRVSLVIVRVLIGALFIYSGWTKVSPIEPLEFAMLEYSHLPWLLNGVIARLLISLELLLGILLIFNIRPKVAIRSSSVLLCFFTLYLLFVLVTQGNDGNCGCFGVKHSFTPLEGIIKNIVTLLLLALFAKFNSHQLLFNKEKVLFIIVIVASVAFPQIKEPMDLSVADKFEQEVGKDLGLDSLSTVIYHDQQIEIQKGKYLVAFFSMGCKYCKLTSQKLALISNRTDADFRRFYFFGKNKSSIPRYEEDLLKFWKETRSDVVPNRVLVKKTFYGLAGLALPAVYLVEDGVVKKRLNFRSIDEKVINDFFGKD